MIEHMCYFISANKILVVFASVSQEYAVGEQSHARKQKNQSKRTALALTWWGKVDSNHRSRRQQIYSLPHLTALEFPHMKLWSWWTDSNPRPADYKSAALPAELHQQFQQQGLSYQKSPVLSTGFFRFFCVFFKEGAMLSKNIRRRWRHPLYCTLCGREIPAGWEYWYCNGSCVCPDCLLDFARSELAPFRRTHGQEVFL